MEGTRKYRDRLILGGAMAPNVAAREKVVHVRLVVCPECHAPAEIVWRSMLESTEGPIEVAKTMCLDRHWFLMPLGDLSPM